MKKIKIKGRTGLKHEIVPIEDNLYQFIPDKDCYSVRFIGDRTDALEAIDPDGGPFISTGNSKIIPGKTIENIYVEDDVDIFFATY